MSLYVERWIARPAWLALSVSDRIAYLDQMGAAFHSLTRAGMRLIGVSVSGADTPHRTGERYVAAWSMPGGPSQGQRLEDILEAAGWHDYFVPVNDRTPRRAPRPEDGTRSGEAPRSVFDFVSALAPTDGNGSARSTRPN